MRYHSPTIFAEYPELTAGFIGRGVHLPNANLNTISDPGARGIFEQIATSVGFDPQQVIATRQVHGADIAVVPQDSYGATADAIITSQPGYLLTIRMADCAAILLYDPVHHAVAGIHAGWKGTVAGVAPKTIARLTEIYGMDPTNLRIYVGPAIGRLDFEVDPDVAERFDRRYWHPHPTPGKVRLDYVSALVDQLTAAGVPDTQIERDPRSTFSDDSLHSLRRDQADYAHNVAFIGLRTN